MSAETCTLCCSSFVPTGSGWEQPRRPSAREGLHQPWSIQTAGCCSALTRNKLSGHAQACGDLTCTLRSEAATLKKVA